jgi:hypothetical protein
MRSGWLRFILLAALVALGFWGWHFWFPSPEQVIRRSLAELARNASFSSNETPLAKLYNAQALGKFFTADVQITFDAPGASGSTVSGRDQLLERAMGARSAISGLKVEFPDIAVTIGPEKESAIVDITAKARVEGERDSYLQELRVTFRKSGRQWLIRKVETVKTLS